ncbi:cutinase [Coprinopsis cinerea okayama7|uniref:cutinase n=1 Tax=Coprinopsis cinerea (strain Okayama-7 / 130 / ATCC MYA-4618 / FGSC 9003) TaxID=240176 RepID=A8NH79_COPC7|nr:cutinase [Coprinopsis cinerea okayama7\|eukprot:XP_001833705.1 cutinase [Coprinopsis cinerea okayama7\
MKFTTLVTLALGAVSALAAPAAELESRQLFCRDVYVFFARGTGEIGTLGTVVGPSFSAAVSLAVRGSVDFEGIDYPALVTGYLAGGDRGGARTMADKVASTASRCPNAKIFISGYSQGAQVTHLAARQLSAANQARVTGVVTFGDPYRDDALPGGLDSRRKTYCNFGDLICDGLPTILAPHLTYGSDASDAARWVAARV